MHPISALRELSPIEKDVVDILARSKQAMTQIEVRAKLRGSSSQPTVSRVFSSLISNGIIVKSGETKGAKFALSDVASYFAIPPQLRQPVPYDPSRIAKYVPNETTWLPNEIAEGFKHAAQGVMHQLDASTYSQQIAERFLLDLSWASSNLEGNTYDYLATEVLLKYGEQATGHDLIEATMILNHKHALVELLENVEKPQLDMRYVSRLHAMLMRDLIGPEQLGRVRDTSVRITATSYRPESNRDQLSTDLGTLLWKAEQVQDPFESSFMLLAGMSYLQAFVDGNKRMGRVLCNIPLLARGLPPMSFIGIDRGNYLSGLIAFYETADTSLLAETLLDAYRQSAPSYAAAVATQRRPRGVELRERMRIQTTIAQLIADKIRPENAEGYVRDVFSDIPVPDQDILVGNIIEVLDKITPENSAAWNIDEDIAEAYRAIIDIGDSTPGFEF
ncbi:Fic family protein [Devosia sp. UYZn731]|uniref:Fic family protein n=1 Tax=Devosia sp. UYZn731 TaxID=3156345 RepID=UPI003398500D